MTQTDPLAQLDARKTARQGILDRAIERAHKEAASIGRTLTCLHKPLEQHHTCAGINADVARPTGCLCECHDAELLAQAASTIAAVPSDAEESAC